jgi:hypothetical protein
MSFEKAKFWSTLDPKPVLVYLPKHHDYIVAWNNILMPHKMALVIGMTLSGIFPTPEMKRCLNVNYRQLYYANAFQTNGAWDNIVEDRGDMYTVVAKMMDAHMKTLHEKGYSGKEVLGWFDYSRAITD